MLHSSKFFPAVVAVAALIVTPFSYAESRQPAITPDGLTKSYAFYIGSNLTAQGNVLLGGTGEEVSSHWLEIVPRQHHPEDAKITVGVTGKANIPGKLIKIPQAEVTYKYISMTYSNYVGFPPPLTNGGMNEYQVAGRDVWSPSRQELVEMTPIPQTGPQYSDLARIPMSRAKTAQEAVEIIGRLIDKYGYSTYGGNTHIFADPHEGWIVKEMAGGKGLWVAERLGPNEIRVAYPGYIGEIPLDYKKNPNYMGSDNLISFAVKRGWYDPDSGEPFNIHEIYGAQDMNLKKGPKLLSPKEIEQELRALVPITVDELMEMVRDPRIVDDHAGYGQVAVLKDDLKYRGLALLWVAPTGSVTAPFVPWRIGVQKVLPEYRQHRYLTRGAAASFLDDDYQLQEATRFVGRVFKQLMYYTCAHPERFLPPVTQTIEAFEERLLKEQDMVTTIARTLYEAGKDDAARQYLTWYSNTRARQALQLGLDLVAGIGRRTQVLYNIPEPNESDDIGWYYDEAKKGDIDCLAVPGVDPDLAGDVPAEKWRTEIPGVENTGPKQGADGTDTGGEDHSN